MSSDSGTKYNSDFKATVPKSVVMVYSGGFEKAPVLPLLQFSAMFKYMLLRKASENLKASCLF